MNFDAILEKALDGRLSPEESEWMARQIARDPGLAARWIEAATNEASLREIAASAPALSPASTAPRAVAAPRSSAIVPMPRKAPALRWLAAAAGLLAAASLGWYFVISPARQATELALPMVQSIEGSATIEDAGRSRAAGAGRRFHARGTLRTSPGSSVHLAWSDGTSLRLEPESALVVEKPSASAPAKRLRLLHGGLSAEAAPQPQGRPMRIRTPHAAVEVLGTRFSIVARGTGSEVTVEKGAVQITRFADGATSQVAAGQSTRIEPAGALLIKHRRPMQGSTPLWRIGRNDLSHGEFGELSPREYSVPGDWAGRKSWRDFRWGLDAKHASVDLRFALSTLPEHGALLTLRTLNSRNEKAGYAAPLAVFSNGALAGMVQTWKAPRVDGQAVEYRRIYRLYVPREFLRPGENVLRLELEPHPFSQSRESLEIEWDFIEFGALLEPAIEPWHGSYVSVGALLDEGADAFRLSPAFARHLPQILQWMGVAHSGNTMVLPFWKTATPHQPARRVVLEALRGLHCTAALSLGAEEDHLRRVYAEYGPLFHYHEIAHEPDRPPVQAQDSLIAAARTARAIRRSAPGASHVVITGPGWAFAGWGSSASARRAVDIECEAASGHSSWDGYAFTNFRPGGSFTHTLQTFGGRVDDGLDREWLATACGSDNTQHSHQHFIPQTLRFASNFDRILRAHTAVTDRFMHRAPFFHSANHAQTSALFARVADWDALDPRQLASEPAPDAGPSRLQLFRRIALAYGTHGRPLPMERLDSAASPHSRIYVRAVDASALPPLPGSGAKTRKLLISFVNFGSRPGVAEARIHFPAPGHYSGLRIGPEAAWSEAATAATIEAAPAHHFRVPLGPHEAVQYILDPAAATTSAPTAK